MNLTQGWEWRKGVDTGGKERKEGGGKGKQNALYTCMKLSKK